MGLLVEGKWQAEAGRWADARGRVQRPDSSLRNWITPDGRPGPSGRGGFKAEAGRYHLYVAHGCPWAHRTLIYRALKELEGAITVAYAIPGLKDHGWTFADDPNFPDCTPDTVNGFT